MAYMNILEDLKALRKSKFNVVNIQSYIIQIMENFFYSMFDYKNFPKSMPKEYAERYLIWYGEVAAGKVPEEYNKGIYKGEAVFLHSNTAGGDDGKTKSQIAALPPLSGVQPDDGYYLNSRIFRTEASEEAE